MIAAGVGAAATLGTLLARLADTRSSESDTSDFSVGDDRYRS